MTTCWLHGQTRVYYNQSTTPLTHWPFRRQTAKRSEVSPEVNLMGWPRLKCLGPGSGHPTSFPFLLCTTRSTSSAHRTSPSTRSTLAMRFLSTCNSHSFFPRRTNSTYSQYPQPYRISAHRGTPNLSSTLSPHLAVSCTAVPLPVRCRLSVISYHYDFALLAFTVSMCETLLSRSYIVIKWSLEQM